MESVIKRQIIKYKGGSYEHVRDQIIVEEPLEIFFNLSKVPSLVTMRTPGMDIALTHGLLFTMGLIGPQSKLRFSSSSSDTIRVHCSGLREENISAALQNSSCGLCNRASWEEVSEHSIFPIYKKDIRFEADVILNSPQLLNLSQGHFHKTGGNHKISLIDLHGNLICEAEDVGRHNALDKVVGQCLSKSLLPLSEHIVILSGRCSYEMCQKTWLAGIPVIIALGAPTSKAIELAESAGITLIGFTKSDRFNIYCHPERIIYEKEGINHSD